MAGLAAPTGTIPARPLIRVTSCWEERRDTTVHPMDPDQPPGNPESDPPDEGVAPGEPRLPVMLTLTVAAALPLLMPDQLLPGPRWVFPVIVVSLAVAMFVLDPGRIDRRSQAVHRVRILLLLVLVIGTSWATAALTRILIVGSASITNSATELLRAGALVWIGLIITFAFLYWELDLGGPGERAHKVREYPDLAFPQELNPGLARPGWRPTFIDYLYLGLTNSLAFSPTDVMPLAHWAKIAMGLQSVASLAVIGLVIARAVNILQ